MKNSCEQEEKTQNRLARASQCLASSHAVKLLNMLFMHSSPLYVYIMENKLVLDQWSAAMS